MQTRSPIVVGRAGELRVLREALRRGRAGRGGTVFLIGEPGIGKTRLTGSAIGEAIEAGMRPLCGRGSTIGPMVPYRPLTEALLSLVRGGDLGDIEELGVYRPIIARLAPELGAGGEAPATASPVLLAEAVLRLLVLAGRDRGCLLVLEDLQNVDVETLTVVEYLIDNIPTQPVVLVLTIRAEPCPALDLAHAAAQRGAGVVLDVPRLTSAEVAAMTASCLETPLERIPSDVPEQLWADSAGNPFIVEEELHGLIDTGSLVPVVGGWELVGPVRTHVPPALVRSIATRTDRLDPPVRELLRIAAVLGHRFPLSVIRQVTGDDDRAMVAGLRACVAAQLVVPDEPAPDWYAFRHPLTAEAVLAGLTPLERAELSDRAADAVQLLHPELAGDWCPLLASLRLAAGDTGRAGELFTEAGRRALDRGAPDSAVSLLEQAARLLSDHGDVERLALCLESLLLALGETGRFDSERTSRLAATIDQLGGRGLSRARRAALHCQLAKVAEAAGRWAEGMAQVEKARALLGPAPDEEDAAPVDAVAASLTLGLPVPDRLDVAAELAARAATAAERAGLPGVACEALQLLGMLARDNNLAQADSYFAHSLQLAEQHRLPLKRINALVWLGGSACLADGSTSQLAEVRLEAVNIGAITVAYTIDAMVGLQAVLRGEYAEAECLLDECWQAVSRLRIIRLAHYVLVAKAVLAAHRSRRADMERVLADLDHWGGAESPEQVPAMGLAKAFCALLEEERELARGELAAALAYEEEKPTGFYLAGKHGLNLLLGVLAGEQGWADVRDVTACPASRMRWNHQFVCLARAVLLGREGDQAAESWVDAAQRAAAIYPMARHLGLRLIAEEAHELGWGCPVDWLRRAEHYFHEHSVPAVASACRSVIRQVGAPVRQRRSGSHLVPQALRASGVTVREFEVLQLVAERMGNKAIGTRLFISPRTVEKHVANLIAKTGLPGREELATYARDVLSG